MNKPIFVALDVDSEERAKLLAKEVQSYVGGFKLGPRLLIKYGPGLIQELSEYGEVFVDNKYFDIPSTVVSAVRSTFEAGATFVTVHACNGRECLLQLAELERELNQKRSFKILAVTVLTSFNTQNKPANWKDSSLESQVVDLAGEAFSSGLTGIVCSGHEVKLLRNKFPQGYFVTPGIRLPEDKADDQKRVLTPNLAIKNGASALVVGRPIVGAENPREAAKKIWESISFD